MRSRVVRIAVLAIALLGTLTAVSSAQAANWRSSSTASFTATVTGGTPTAATTYLQVGTGPVLRCSNSGATGAISALTGPAYPGTWTGAASVTPTFNTCTAPAGPFNVVCAAGSLNAASTLATAANDGKVTSGVSTGGLTGVSCAIRTGSTQGSGTLCSTISGKINNGSYTNPAAAGGTGSLKFTVGDESLVSTISGSGCLGITNGAAKYSVTSPPSSAPSTQVVQYNIASAPSIWQS